MSENKKEEKLHKAFGWHKSDDGSHSLVEIAYTESGEATVVSSKNLGGLRGKIMLAFEKAIIKAKLYVPFK